MQEIEFTISTVEIAEMLDNTPHKDILKKLEGRTGKDGKHIKGYIEILNEHQMSPVDFFQKSTYKDAKGEERPCYKVTKKGCEFLANKFTGEKGVVFTARYINRFHEMQDMITQAAEPKEQELSWFIKRFKGRYVILWRDFEKLTGVDFNKRIHGWAGNIIAGRDYDGWGEKDTVIEDEFKKKYGFEYGDDATLSFFTLSGVRRVLRLFHEGGKIKIDRNVERLMIDEIEKIEMLSKERVVDFLWNFSNLTRI